MKHLRTISSVTLLVVLLLAGCSSKPAILTTYAPDPESGEYREINYSRVLDGKAVIVPEEIGLYMLMELDERKISGLYELRQSMGALGPNDSHAGATLTFFFHNFTDKPIELDLTMVNSSIQKIKSDPSHLVLPPNKTIHLKVGRLSTSWYRTDMDIEFNFVYEGKTGGGTLTLQRRTLEEVAKMNEKLAQIQTKKH